MRSSKSTKANEYTLYRCMWMYIFQDSAFLRPRHDPTIWTGPDNMDETLLDNDEMLDLMSKITVETPIRDEFLWKDKGLKELLIKCRPDPTQPPPKPTKPLGNQMS